MLRFDSIVFDFDGVLTDNLVYLDQNGKEFVVCNRSDGLAFNILKNLEFNLIIVSTETNPVVSKRGNKLNIPVIQNINKKDKKLLEMHEEKIINLDQTMYVGNDLNDFRAMLLCKVKCCPADSHPKIKEIADIVLKTRGGRGVVREIVEDVLKINMLDYID